MSSRVTNQEAKVTKHLPNKRERASAQYGQLETEKEYWFDDNVPQTLQEAINRIAQAHVSVHGKIP